MTAFLDRLSWGLIVSLAIFAGLAPWPAGEMPHLLEKLQWLAEGRLTRPIDIFDLVFHTSPTLLAVAKLAAGRSGRADETADAS